MLGVSLRARWDATLVSLINTVVFYVPTSQCVLISKILANKTVSFSSFKPHINSTRNEDIYM